MKGKKMPKFQDSFADSFGNDSFAEEKKEMKKKKMPKFGNSFKDSFAE